MTKTIKSNTDKTSGKSAPNKQQQIVDLLQRDGGATLEEMSTLASWLPHSTRAYMTGLKKEGYVIDSEKTDGIRRYHIVATEAA